VLYTDYKLDESYTASKISFREGTDLYDLHASPPRAPLCTHRGVRIEKYRAAFSLYTCLPPQEVRSVDLDEPSGWVKVKLEGKRPGWAPHRPSFSPTHGCAWCDAAGAGVGRSCELTSSRSPSSLTARTPACTKSRCAASPPSASRDRRPRYSDLEGFLSRAYR
jgi:hypothetical protein